MKLRWLIFFFILIGTGMVGGILLPTAGASLEMGKLREPTLPGWTSFGPYGGSVSELLANPNNPNVVYALSRFMNSGAALHYSTDAGATWKESTLFRWSDHLEQVLFDPYTPTTLYAIGKYLDAPNSNYIFPGPFRSRDGGRTWQPIQEGLPNSSSSAVLFLSPAATNVLYLEMRGISDAGMFRSDDYGDSWLRIDYPVDPETIYYNRYDLALDPNDPQMLYLSAQVGDEGHIYRSIDGGMHWQQRDVGLLATQIYRQLLIAPDDPNRLYTISNNRQIYSSEDAGGTWLPLGNLPGEGTMILMAHPAQGDSLYAYNHDWNEPVNLFQLRFGQQWEPIPTNVPHRILTAAVSQNGGRLLLATVDGVYASLDNGKTWNRQSNGLGALEMMVRADPHTSERLYAVARGGALYRSDDGARSWHIVNDTFNDLFDIEADPLFAGRWYILRAYEGLYTSNDGGETWTHDPSTEGALSLTVRGMPTPALYLGSSRRILVSTDGGAQWNELPYEFPGTVTEIALNPANPQELIAILQGYSSDLRGGRLFHTTDGGITWSEQGRSPSCREVNEDYPEPATYTLCPTINALVINPERDNVRTMIEIDSAADVLQSVDGGATWNTIRAIAGTPTSLRIHPSDPDQLMVSYMAWRTPAGNHVLGGRFEWSMDGGITWQNVSYGLNGHAVYAIEPDPFDPDQVYLGGFGGVFRPQWYYGTYLPLGFNKSYQ